jgi:uracil-DNA glycosylase family 4
MVSFFDDEQKTAPPRVAGRFDLKLLHKMECKLCPLAQVPNKNPNMPATGSERPVVYMLAEAPGATEDDENEQLVGDSGALVRARIPRDFKGDVRFNNVVRTRPPKNREPTDVEIECCRPSVERDIERTKPKAIFGFGNVPLGWVMAAPMQGITMWRGRRMPLKVGSHTCWYYPMLHPAFILRSRGKRRDESATFIGSEDERVFAFDLKKAFAEVDDLPVPYVHVKEDVYRGMEYILEGGKAGLAKLAAWFSWALDQPALGIDYETNALRPYGVKPKLLSAAVCNADKGFAFAFEHPDAKWSKADLVEVYDMWYEFLDRYEGVKYVHNLSFELEWTGVKVNLSLIRKGKWEDTSVQASVLDERKGSHKPGCFSLEFLVQQHFGFNLKKFFNVDRKNLATVPLPLVLRYNGGDSRYHYYLGIHQHALLKAEKLLDVYYDALRRVPTVVLSQIKGAPVDFTVVEELKTKYETRFDKIQAQIEALPVIKEFKKRTGGEFKPLSNKDVLYVFKDMLKEKECVVWDKKNKEDRYGVDESVLEKIKHPLAKLLLDYRGCNKQLSTYIYPLDPEHEETVVHPDGLLHATFNTIFARTGRLSCEEPNLQNFPKRDGEAKEVRRQIKAPPGCVVLAVDYGQIEARVIAMFTEDKVFCKALWENYDVHMEWAERISRAYPERVGGKKNFTDKKIMKDFRIDIKNQWTFPLFFGASLASASGYLNIPENKLAPEYNVFWEQFSGVKDWQGEQLAFYREHGYVECLDGRRRRGPISTNMVYNSPVQGTAAKIVMDGMCRLSELGDPELQPEINIHDDLTFLRVPAKRFDDIAEKVINEMLDVPYDFVNVPITVDASMGPDWLELEEIGTFSSDTWFKK